ncbi:MAG: hypothetical protein LBL54_02545 [Clostridiales Family XIII bacterium]|jgi:hypothetical protein|nr:hypothetical protein [Clostridiales Family XIII bacterium]
MADIYWAESAKEQLASARASVENYFIGKSLGDILERQIEKFRSELSGKLKLIKESPRVYMVRMESCFSGLGVRSFTAYWFTFFYVYDENEDAVTILFVRPSTSDLSTLLP